MPSFEINGRQIGKIPVALAGAGVAFAMIALGIWGFILGDENQKGPKSGCVDYQIKQENTLNSRKSSQYLAFSVETCKGYYVSGTLADTEEEAREIVRRLRNGEKSERYILP